MLTFTVLDSSNTAVLTLNDPRPNNAHSRKIATLADNRELANQILRYARERGIPVRMVEYAITWPDDMGRPVTRGFTVYDSASAPNQERAPQ